MQGPRKYALSTPSAVAPWAASMSDSLGALLGHDDLGRTALALCQASLQPRSYGSYASALKGFLEFCDEESLLPLDVTPVHVARYLAWLGLRGTVAAASLQPYLSAINRLLKDHGKPPVALGPLVADVRAGLGNSQVPLSPAPARIPLPAPVALDILVEAESVLSTTSWFSPQDPAVRRARALVAVLVNYIFFCRGECGVSLRSSDISVHDGFLTLLLRKVKGRAAFPEHRLPLLQISTAAIPRIAAVFTQFVQGRLLLAARNGYPVPSSLWALHPSDLCATWSAATLTTWLSEACAVTGHRPPPGFTWTSHSLRKGAASAANAINVVLPKIRYMGGWARDSDVVLDYIDPTMAPTPAALLFFGHMLAV